MQIDLGSWIIMIFLETAQNLSPDTISQSSLTEFDAVVAW